MLDEITVKSCTNVDKALWPSKDREPHFLQCVSISKWLCLYFFIIISIRLYWCQFGREYRRKNQGLLTTRSPCDTTFHSIKEVKVLLPSVWFTREKEREKVVMLLRYLERHGEETADNKTEVRKTL